MKEEQAVKDQQAVILRKAVIEASKHLIPPFVLFGLKDGISGIIEEEKLGKFHIALRRAPQDEELINPVYDPRTYAMLFATWYNEKRSFIELNKMSMESAMIEFQITKKHLESNIPNKEEERPVE